MRILFASMPMDGHFNPLTAVAVHLRARGHDVRWYTGPTYAARLRELGIPHLPYVRASDVNGENLAERFPEYARMGTGPRAIAFALEQVFFGNLAAQLADVRDVHRSFPFTAIVFDAAFYAGRLVHEALGARAFAVWPAPTPAPNVPGNPPPFFGLAPMAGPLGWLRDRVVSKLHANATRGGMKKLAELRSAEGLPPYDGDVFDLHNDTSQVLFRWGSPSTDFAQMRWPAHAVFAGPLLPHKAATRALLPSLAERLARYGGRCVVVSQGTIDNRDAEKLFVPTLTAFAGSERLLVATTGGRNTTELRARFPQANVVVEDYVDFGALMPAATLFVSNGGAGSVMHALVHGVPVITAGRLEGKSDINVRIHARGLGIDLGTERPRARAIAKAARRIAEGEYPERAAAVRDELARYDSCAILERAIVRSASADAAAPLD